MKISVISVFLILLFGLGTLFPGCNRTREWILDVSFQLNELEGYTRSDQLVIWLEQPDGTFVPTTVNIFDAVFGGVDASASGDLEAYTLAADDSRTVVNFIHEFEVPDQSVATH